MTGDSFQRLQASGFTHLLPIIPHDATISSYSKSLQGREDALGKIPGKRVSDGWVGFYGWEDYEASSRDLIEWGDDGAGIGMRCAGVVAVDIDVTDPALVRLIRKEAITHLGFAPARTGNAPKVLLLFRIEGEDLPTKVKLSFTDYHGSPHHIELLGARQQFIVEGIHPKTERPYAWDEHPADVGFDGLPTVRVEDLDTFLGACAETLAVFDCGDIGRASGGGHDERDPENLRSPHLDILADTVRQIPNDEDTERERMVAMAHAIRAACDDDPGRGLEIFTEWADRWPGGQRDGEIEHVYWSARPGSVGTSWLFDQARIAGVDTVEADFGPIAANDDSVIEEDPDDGTLWSSYVYVNSIQRFVDRRKGLWLNKEQFNDVHTVPDAKKKPAQVFLEHRRPYSFADMPDYVPGEPGGVYTDEATGRQLYNTWRPGPAHSGEWAQGPTSVAAVQTWLTLAEHVIPNSEERENFYDWLAHLLQCPGVKPSWHPLLGSAIHGTGKDSLMVPIVRGLGPNARTVQAKDLEGEWTWWAQDVQLVIVSEMHSFERRSVMNKLKSLMASPPDTIGINIKGVPQFDVRNTFGLVMFSNEQDAVAIERGDRRFFVIWSEKEPLEQSFYIRYHRWLEQGGAAAVCRWLQARDIAHFDPKSRAPDTDAKQVMRESALGQLESLLCMAIEDETGPFRRDLVTMAEIQTWLQSKVRNMPGPHRLASTLKMVGCYSLGRARVGEERERLYACRRTETYAALRPTSLRNLLIEQREDSSGATADFAEKVKP